MCGASVVDYYLIERQVKTLLEGLFKKSSDPWKAPALDGSGLFSSVFLVSKSDPGQVNVIFPVRVSSEAIIRRHKRLNNTSCNLGFFRVVRRGG